MAMLAFVLILTERGVQTNWKNYWIKKKKIQMLRHHDRPVSSQRLRHMVQQKKKDSDAESCRQD